MYILANKQLQTGSRNFWAVQPHFHAQWWIVLLQVSAPIIPQGTTKWTLRRFPPNKDESDCVMALTYVGIIGHNFDVLKTVSEIGSLER